MTGPCAVHSENPAVAQCAVCQRPVCDPCALRVDGEPLQRRCPVCAPLGIPWERRSGSRVLNYLQTVFGALFTPERTFRTLPTARRFAAPLKFDLITLYLGWSLPTVLTAWSVPTLVNAMAITGVPLVAPWGQTWHRLAMLLIYSFPLSAPLAALFDFLMAGLIHGALRFMGIGEGGFRRTYAAVVYGSSATLLNATVILWLFFIPQLWNSYTTIIALRQAHRTSTFRATPAVVVPYGVLTLAIGAVVFSLLERAVVHMVSQMAAF